MVATSSSTGQAVGVGPCLYPTDSGFQLKAFLSTQEKKHDLKSLFEKLRYFLNVEFGATIPTWFES
jgi:hypothetical protein